MESKLIDSIVPKARDIRNEGGVTQLPPQYERPAYVPHVASADAMLGTI